MCAYTHTIGLKALSSLLAILEIHSETQILLKDAVFIISIIIIAANEECFLFHLYPLPLTSFPLSMYFPLFSPPFLLHPSQLKKIISHATLFQRLRHRSVLKSCLMVAKIVI